MTYAKILAPLTGGSRDAAVLATALAAAKPFCAHVVAFFVRPDPVEALPFLGEGVSGAMAQEIADTTRNATDKALTVVRNTLDSVAQTANATVLERPAPHDGVSVSLRETEGNFVDKVVEAARLSDLVVFGPFKEGDSTRLSEAFEETLLDVGRPVILTSQSVAKNFARRIAIGWDGSRSCAHALTAALPYLTRADAIDLLTIRRANIRCPSCEEAREYLALRGLACGEHVVDAGHRPIGEALLEAASEVSAGLLVLGGNNSRGLRHLFYDSVTKHVVSHAEIPLFLTH